jgi:putative transposase
MARPLRVVVPGAWYHVMARGLERRTIYSDEGYYRRFEELLADLPERFGVRLHTYVLMPNHYHLQIENSTVESKRGDKVAQRFLRKLVQP